MANSHTHFHPADIEISGLLESGSNSTNGHAVVADPDQLIGSQVIDMIMNKPGMIRCFKIYYSLLYFSIEFSFLTKYYSLLYQSLIPNCTLTINTLRQHISISDNIEQYIVGAASHRTSCQRLINFLLTCLYSEKDYMQFCHHFNIISVMSDVPYKLTAGIYSVMCVAMVVMKHFLVLLHIELIFNNIYTEKLYTVCIRSTYLKMICFEIVSWLLRHLVTS